MAYQPQQVYHCCSPGGEVPKVGIMLLKPWQLGSGNRQHLKGFQAGVLNTGGSDNTISKVTSPNQIIIFNTGTISTVLGQTTCSPNSIGVASTHPRNTAHPEHAHRQPVGGCHTGELRRNVLDFNTIWDQSTVCSCGLAKHKQQRASSFKDSGVDINNNSVTSTRRAARQLCHASGELPDGCAWQDSHYHHNQFDWL